MVDSDRGVSGMHMLKGIADTLGSHNGDTSVTS